MMLAQLFDHEDTEQLLELVNQIRSTVSGMFDASELLQRLYEKRDVSRINPNLLLKNIFQNI